MGDLVTAIKDHQYDRAKELLEQGADPNDFHPTAKTTALMMASLHGHLDLIRLLIAKGADIHADNNHYRAIHGASVNGHLEAVQLLLESGADIEDMAPKGGTPLSWAISMNRAKVVEYLLAQGAKTSSKLLEWAIQKDVKDTIDVLKKHEAKKTGNQ